MLRLTYEAVFAVICRTGFFLRRSLINLEMIDWLVDLLEGHEQLSEYTIEYAVALLMNLCLRSSGKKRCIARPSKILKALITIL